jgi:hypothetical protein
MRRAESGRRGDLSGLSLTRGSSNLHIYIYILLYKEVGRASTPSPCPRPDIAQAPLPACPLKFRPYRAPDLVMAPTASPPWQPPRHPHHGSRCPRRSIVCVPLPPCVSLSSSIAVCSSARSTAGSPPRRDPRPGKPILPTLLSME